MLDKLLEKRPLIIILIAVGVLAIAGAAYGLFWLNNTGNTATVSAIDFPEPPPDRLLELPLSLEEISSQYPDLAPLLNDKSLGSVYKDFIIAFEEGGVEGAKNLAAQRGMLTDDGFIRMTLIIDSPEFATPVVEELTKLGIIVINYSATDIYINIPMAFIENIAANEGSMQMLFGQLTQMDHIIRIKLPIPSRTKESFLDQNIIGEGVAVTNASAWHQAGFTGQGVKIAILDLGFNGYRDMLGTELPANVTTKAFLSNTDQIDDTNEVHGAACAEIVHEMAPDAELYLVMFDGNNDLLLQEAVDWLVAQDVDIISYSVGKLYGPKDGSGWDARLVDSVAAKGIVWVGAAGNEAEHHYRGTFTDTDGNNQHEFPDGYEVMAFQPYSDYFDIILQWDDWDTANQDIELHLYDSNFNLLASSTESQAGQQGEEPVEYIYYENWPMDSVYYVAIEAYEVNRPITFDMFITPAVLGFNTVDHSLSSPADAKGSLTVGATEWYDDSIAVYSSQGPTDDGRIKPDISAPTSVSDKSYAPYSFTGTSASTPHIAGAAGLILSAHPEYTREQIIDTLINNVVDLGPSGPDSTFGVGRLALPSPPMQVDTPPLDPIPTVEVPVELPTIVVPEIEIPDIDEPVDLPTLPPLNEIVTQIPPVELPPVEIPDIGLPTIDPNLDLDIPVPGDITSRITDTAQTILIATICLVSSLICGGVLFIGGIILFLMNRRRKQSAFTPSLSYPSQTQNQQPFLEINGQVINLTPAGLNMGRSKDSQLVLPDTQVSRYHARISLHNGVYYIQDLDSANGVFVNGHRITSREPLRPGDQIKIGPFKLNFRI